MDLTLSLFSQSQLAKADILQGSEQYLVKQLEPVGECNTFDDLRYHLYMNKIKTNSDLTPASVSMMGHMLSLEYFVYVHSNLCHPQQSINLYSINLGWERENGLLTPAKFCKRLPVEYTVTCGCKKHCNGRCKCRQMEEKCSEFCTCGNT